MESRRIVKDENGNVVQGAMAFTGDESVLVVKHQSIMTHFKYDHLPEDMQAVSAHVCECARKLDEILPAGPEKETCLRKLLEAKDCAVRTLIK